jgi:sulfotransferase family protein
MGTLPDFLIIGAAKSGTTTLYGLLRSHPHVRAAVRREIHYFDKNFEKGIEWYRGHFKPGANRGGRRTITGESSPSYLPDERVPRRVAEILPEVRLIALLRNPVDRAYSHYQQAVKHGRAHLSFEEVIEAEISRSSGSKRYLARGIYVDQLKRWHRCFDREQLLVVKSEDFFGNTPDTLKCVLNFLALPEWKPDHLPVKNKGSYTQQMSPETRARLRDYFEPHNKRLYDYLGTDFGWGGSLKPAGGWAKRPGVYYPATGEPQSGTGVSQEGTERPWWRRMFGG